MKPLKMEIKLNNHKFQNKILIKRPKIKKKNKK